MEDIASLAEKGPFAALSVANKEQVLALISATDFDKLHEILKCTRSLDADVAPPAALGMRLQQRIAVRSAPAPRVPFLRRVMSWQVPVWQAAAVLLLAFAINWYVANRSETFPAAPSPIVQAVVRTDTVLLETVRWKERIVWRERFATAPIPVSVNVVSAELSDPVSLQTPVSPTPIEISTTGSPIGAQPELLQFFTQPDSK